MYKGELSEDDDMDFLSRAQVTSQHLTATDSWKASCSGSRADVFRCRVEIHHLLKIESEVDRDWRVRALHQNPDIGHRMLP